MTPADYARANPAAAHELLGGNPMTEPADLLEMTFAERKALPAKYHQPYWMGLTKPASWICTACWDEGLTTGWPCEVAQGDGKAVAEAGGLGFSW